MLHNQRAQDNKFIYFLSSTSQILKNKFQRNAFRDDRFLDIFRACLLSVQRNFLFSRTKLFKKRLFEQPNTKTWFNDKIYDDNKKGLTLVKFEVRNFFFSQSTFKILNFKLPILIFVNFRLKKEIFLPGGKIHSAHS